MSYFSINEQRTADLGLKRMADAMRSARIANQGHSYEDLREIQHQANFPFLVLGTVLLHRYVISKGFRNILMCSRDAYLWMSLMTRAKSLFSPRSYELTYFYTSRLTRYFPSQNILDYTHAVSADAALLVDLCGSGKSIKALNNSLKRAIPAWIMLRYAKPRSPAPRHLSYAVTWNEETSIELANLADHEMTIDMYKEKSGTYRPIFINPTQHDWRRDPAIRAMHEAFNSATKYFLVAEDVGGLDASDGVILEHLTYLLRYMDDRHHVLKKHFQTIFGPEEVFIRCALAASADRAGMVAPYK